MLVWSVLALFALGAVSEDKVTSETTTSSAVKDPKPIAYSNGGGQVFDTSDQLIESYRHQRPVSPELPAVIPSGHHLPAKIPSKELEVPLETISTSESTLITPGSTNSTHGSTISITVSTPGTIPPRPTFSHSLHLRDELTVPSSDYTEVYDISWHAESNTARTIVENSTIIYRMPQDDEKVLFLRIGVTRTTDSVQRICTKSPPIAVSPKDKGFPALPDFEPFQFVGYMTEEGRQVERWQHVVVGKPGEGGAVQGESLNFTHDFLIYREGGQAVPLRYTVVTDSSVLGPLSDSYSHRYSLLPAPTAPILPDTAKECDIVEEFEAERHRSEKLPQKVPDVQELEDILTPTLL